MHLSVSISNSTLAHVMRSVASRDAGTIVPVLRWRTCSRRVKRKLDIHKWQRAAVCPLASLKRTLDRSGRGPGGTLARRPSQSPHPVTTQKAQFRGLWSWSLKNLFGNPLLLLWIYTLTIICHLLVVIDTAILETHFLQSLFQDFHTAFSTGFPETQKHKNYQNRRRRGWGELFLC